MDRHVKFGFEEGPMVGKARKHKDRIPGGLADKRKPQDFDASDLADGIGVEMEHTSSRAIATEIAMDHLTEDRDYYVKLKTVEKGGASELDELLKAHKLAGRCEFQGMKISIENAKGSKRRWYDPHAKVEGFTTMLFPYGYIRGTLGTDGDHVDVYVGDNPNAENVYIINQVKAPEFKEFDEQKCMLGFDSDTDAKAAYLAHFDDVRFFGSMERMDIADFRARVLKKDNHGLPVEPMLGKATGNKPPRGYTKAPGSKKGGYRKKVGGQWDYWYPPHKPAGRPKKKKAHVDPTKPPKPRGGPVREAGEGTAIRFKGSTTDKAERPGLWKMENGAFHTKRQRVFEMAADGKRIRETKQVPNVDEQTKLQLIEEFTPLIRKAARDTQRKFAIRSRTELGPGGSRNDVQTELQRAGIEGLLNAVRTYRGRVPFAQVAKTYVGKYVALEARQQRGSTELPQMHHLNLRKFIGARVKAQVKFKTMEPTMEQVASVFELRLKHIHSGVEPVTRNELVPMTPYKLALGRHGAAPPKVRTRGKEGTQEPTQMRDVVEQRSRVEWARMYDNYLKGDKGALSFDAAGQQIFAELYAGHGMLTEDQIVVRNQINFAMEKMKGLGEVEIEGPAPGRPRGGKQATTKYSIVDVAEVLKRRLGLEGHDEHSINQLAEVIPIYRKTASGDWQEISARSGRQFLQQFIDIGVDKLKGAVQGRMASGVVERAGDLISPRTTLPSGPTYHIKLKELATNMTAGQVEGFRQAQVVKLQALAANSSGDRKAIFERSITRVRNMSKDEVAMQAARQSTDGQKLSKEMRDAMTRHIDVERISAHEGVAYMFDPRTKAHTSVRVGMNYDRSYEAATPAGKPLRKGFAVLTDSILREIQRWPDTMELLISDSTPTYLRHNLELMAL
jgi:hypothetical protein